MSGRVANGSNQPFAAFEAEDLWISPLPRHEPRQDTPEVPSLASPRHRYPIQAASYMLPGFGESPRLGFQALCALARWLGSRHEQTSVCECLGDAVATTAAWGRSAVGAAAPAADPEPLERGGDRRSWTGISCRGGPASRPRRLRDSIKSAWRSSTFASRRLSRLSATKNRPSFNMRWSTGRSSSAGRARPSSPSMTTLADRAAPSKEGLVSSGWWRKWVLATWGWFWVSRCPVWRDRVGTGINCWRSARCLTR